MPTDSYMRPSNLADALQIRAQTDPVATVVAGCTDVFPATDRKILTGSILDVTRIDGLRGISRDDHGMRIGANTTWSDICKADLPPACLALQQAAAKVGAKQIQNRGTIGGNLCNASPAADGVPPLLCLDAQVELQSLRGTRVLPLSDFLRGVRDTDLAADELLTAVILPASALGGVSAFSKLGARSYLVISIAMVAARIVMKDGIITDAALSVGACSAVATRLPDLEAALIGHPLEPDRIDGTLVAPSISPIADIRADAAYRSDAAVHLVRQTISQIAETTA